VREVVNMGRQRMLTQEQQEEIRRNYKPKESVTNIGIKYGVHHSAIIRILGELYVPCRTTNRKKAMPYGTLPAFQSRLEDNAMKYKQYLEECFKKIQVGQEVHYKSKSATVIQKTSCLVVLKVHRENFDEVRSINKVDVAKGLIA
jgi:hypothetical protein